ncbi:hypothetical protein OAE97_01810 [Verrucomicrobia bacterium]|nr:hypothetical protein [Verrucomicrobiota bacterium]
MGLVTVNFDVLDMCLAIAAGALTGLLLPKKISKFGELALWYVYIILILPFWMYIILLGVGDQFVQSALALYAPFVLIVILYNIAPNTSKPFNIGFDIDISLASKFFSIACVGCGTIMVILLGITFTFDFESVYDRRLNARESVVWGSVGSYVLAAYAKALMPLCVAVSMSPKCTKWGATAGFFGALVVFSFAGHKTQVFAPVVMVLIYIAHRSKKLTPITLAFGAFIVLAFAFMLEMLWGVTFLNNIISRRVFSVPQMLLHVYVEFFQSYGFLWFGDLSFLSGLLGSADQSASGGIIVGEEHFKTGINANVGAIQYGFAEGGIFGSFLYAIAILIYIKIMDRISVGKNKIWILPLAVPVSLRFTEQALHTAILSGGLLWILLGVLVVKDRCKISSLPLSNPGNN